MRDPALLAFTQKSKAVGTLALPRYANQIQSVRCYARAQGYDLWLLSGGEFTTCAELWKAQNGYFFLKHCAAASLLQAQEPGYSLAVLDSDVVAAALDRSLDRWMQSRADLQFYERITGEEVMAGAWAATFESNYIAKNRPWVRAFLRQWASMKDRQPPGFSSADNGALHVVLVETLELSGASRVRELYAGLEAKVDNLQPYWSFVEASMRVLGPPRMWRMEQTSLGREHGCSAEADARS
eukprot:s585_g23.t1